MAQTSNAGVAAGQIRRGRLLAPTLVFLFAFGCFARALANEFVQWDNEKLLLNNIAYRGLGWPQLKYAFTTFFMGPYQPLSWISYSIDWTLWGLNPRGFHLTNLLLHAAASTCFYFLSRRLIELASTGVPPASVQAGAVVAALAFAVHPLRVESVVWAAERRDVLSGLLYVLTLLAYLRYATTDPARRGRWYGAMFLLYGLCLLAKGMAMTLPVVLLILDAYPLRRLTARRVWIEKIPFAALAVLAGALAIVGQRERAYLEGVATFGPFQRIATAGYATCFYLWKTAAPGGLMAMYERPPRLNPFAAQYAACAVLVVLVTAAVIAMRRRQPGLCAAWLYYLVTLAPVSGLVQSGWQIAADRYTYIPMMGFAVWAGGGVAVLLERRSRAGGFLSIGIGLVLAFWGGLTIRQIGFWHDSNRMWKRVLAVDPANAVAWSNLAIRAYLEGDLPTALANEEKAVTFRPDAAMFWQNYGAFLELSGRMEEALKAHRRGAEVAPIRSTSSQSTRRRSRGPIASKMPRRLTAAHLRSIPIRRRRWSDSEGSWPGAAIWSRPRPVLAAAWTRARRGRTSLRLLRMCGSRPTGPSGRSKRCEPGCDAFPRVMRSRCDWRGSWRRIPEPTTATGCKRLNWRNPSRCAQARARSKP